MGHKAIIGLVLVGCMGDQPEFLYQDE
jgi:hypothetical protein